MQLFIFGMSSRYKTVDKGQFFCPHCQAERNYERKTGKNYFSVYFLPIVPLNDLDEIIECTTCGRSYTPEVLKHKLSKPMPEVAKYLNTVKARLDKGYSVEYVLSDLTGEGLDRDIAENMVNMAIGQGRKGCPNCGLTYTAAIDICPDCNVPLKRIGTAET